MTSSCTRSVLDTFGVFKDEIDHHYDRRERLIKASRDITALSKKMIFSLLRVPIISSIASSTDTQGRTKTTTTTIPPNISVEVDKYEGQIVDLLHRARDDLQGANSWRYQKNISPGIQEFVEAVTLRYYIQHERVPAHAETRALVGNDVDLTGADYILGVADLTGELTRRAIAALALPGDAPLDYTRRIARCLRELTIRYQAMDLRGTSADGGGLRELGKKIAVMESSLRKVEVGVFERCVRGKERPEGWVGGHSTAADGPRED